MVQALFNHLLDSLNVGIFLVDQDYRIVVWNKWLEQVSEVSGADAIGKKVSAVCPCFTELKFRRILMDTLVNGQARFCTGALHRPFVVPQSGEKVHKSQYQNMQIEPFYFQEKTFALIQINDVTVQYRRISYLQNLVKGLELDFQSVKQAEEKAKQNALIDPLTGLGNRNLLFSHLESAMAAANREHSQVAVLFIDLDGFKVINDTYGHIVGDNLLKEVAERLKQTVRQTDIVTRFGGDEFVVVLPNIRTADAANRVADKLRRALDVVFKLPGKTVKVTASIGISLYPSDDDNIRNLLEKADKAMYSVKSFGKNSCRFYGSATPVKKRIKDMAE